MRHIEDLSLERAIGALRRAAGTLKSATAKRRWLRTGWECQSYHSLDQGINRASEFHTENWHALGNTLEDQANRLAFLSQRTVPARCLTCFGHHVVEVERFTENEGMMTVHPGCGGHFITEIMGGMNLLPPGTQAIHFPDGTFSHEEPYESLPRNFAGKYD